MNSKFLKKNNSLVTRIILLLTFVGSLFIYNTNLVLGQQDNSSEKFILIHLFFNAGNLVTDRDFAVPYEIISSSDLEKLSFEEDEENEAKDIYRGEIISFQDKTLSTFEFSPSKNRVDRSISASSFNIGKVSLITAYYPQAKEINFYEPSTSNKIISVSVEREALCNENKICESERGESGFTCPSDCISSPTPIPDSQASSGSNVGKWVGIVLYIVGGIVLAVIAWFLYKSRQKVI